MEFIARNIGSKILQLHSFALISWAQCKKKIDTFGGHTELSPLLTILTAPWQLVPISILEQNLAQFFTKIVLNPHVMRSLLMDLYWIYIVWLTLKLEHKMNMESQIQQLVVILGNHHCPETHARWTHELLCGCDLESMQEHGRGVVPRVMPNYFQKLQLLDRNEGPGYSAHPEKLDCWLLFQPSLRIFWEYYTSLKHKRKIGTVSDVTVSWINQWPLTFWQK